MTIPTQLSLQGFIATEPQLSFGESGHARFYCRVGIEQHRKEADGSFTRVEPVFCDLVLFDRAAERAYSRFKPGDQILASGYIHEYEQERRGGASRLREQFVARRLGHDCLRTRYVVDRGPAKPPERRVREVAVANQPSPAVGT
jgi:single-stranded DNA-binding protein